MRHVPLIPTLLVALAVTAMIGLGLWQLLIRLPEKEAFLAQLAVNPAKPPIAFPAAPNDSLLFRRSSGACAPTAIDLAGAGAAGFRAIATCRSGIIVQLGTTRDPMRRVSWAGGTVSGLLSHAPDERSLIGALFDRRPQSLMLVADRPVAGLTANARPDIDSVPNNHLAYAVQWFFFAAVAAIIYALALRRRARAR